MSIAYLRAMSEGSFPLIVDDLEEIHAVRSLIYGGLLVAFGGTINVTHSGQAVVLRPAIIKDVTRMGRSFLCVPDPLLEALGDFH